MKADPDDGSFPIDPQRARAALRCMKQVALANGDLHSQELALLSASARALRIDDPLDDLEPMDPSEAASCFQTPLERTRLVQALILVSMIDGEISREQRVEVERFATALSVQEPRLNNLRQAELGRWALLRLNLLLRSQVTWDVVREAWRREGVKGVYKLSSYAGLGQDLETARKYRRLESYPQGSFGHALWAHYEHQGFGFPGEAKAFPEMLVKHDVVHVLGGYGCDPSGEIDNIAFICGFLKSDPFWYLFAILMQMHMGVRIFREQKTARLSGNPEKMIQALLRGMKVNTDLYDVHLDFWPQFELPLEEVRRRYNIPPV